MLCLLISGCAALEPPAAGRPLASSASAPPPTAAPLPTVAPPSITPIGIASPAVLADGWRRFPWQKIVIDLPPISTWQEHTSGSLVFSDTLVIDQGAITYPAADSGVEGPYGPTFALVRFPGSLDDWIDAERQRNLPGNPVDEPTIEHRELAGTQAVAYQRAIKGVGTIEYYALKVDPEQLLWISVEDTENKTYNEVLDRLSIQP
ncbi:hypothetical protein F8S13_11370 [Chloroflexia bacterium SDU3-3]|nr:hypothetical protein F8S13_11370 [Chloroflexia bacterium SDU3-3]